MAFSMHAPPSVAGRHGGNLVWDGVLRVIGMGPEGIAMDAAVAGLVGAAVGSVATLLGQWIQAHYTQKREKQKLLLEAAIQNRAQDISVILGRNEMKRAAPMAAYILHQQVMNKLVESGKLSAADVEKAFAQHLLDSKRLSELDSKWTLTADLEDAAKGKG
ncbi:hypothetical protein V9K81_09995 [Pseudomonas monteilii]|uniref:hypothetical protein n=1 Tax=Pseudomonas monteilii TaxID=76759 RepID=UPI0030CF4EAF